MTSYSFLLDDGQRIEALLARLEAGAPGGWLPHRIIFRNFWFFQKEEFIWHHGRLFLGGQNAAGKSTVLCMAVPLLLDGNKSEERLNTFGGHGRHMAYYVTGSPTQDDTGEAAYYFPVRTSYMALEFRCGDRWLTFGQGLHHDRSADDKSVRSWGLVITDGRRIGRDGFDLVKENQASLTKAELKKLLGEGGEVFDTNLEYKRTVNRLLFGFKDLRDFDALIDLLLQIRRPKLTKEVKPRDVAEILTQSLPVLDDGVMQVTADSLDHIDQTIQNIERIEVQIRSATEVEKATQTVFRRMAEVAAAQFDRASRATDEASALLSDKETALATSQRDLTAATAGLAECEQQLRALEAERESLQAQGADAFQASEQLAGVGEQIRQKEERLAELRLAVRQHTARVATLTREREEKEARWQEEREAGLEAISSAAAGTEGARWASARAWAGTLRQQWEKLHPGQPHPRLTEDVPRAAVAEAARERISQIGAVEGQVVRRDAALEAWREAQGGERQAHQRLLASEAEVSRKAALVEDGRQASAAAVLGWAAGARALVLPADRVIAMAEALLRYRYQPGSKPQEVLALARPLMEQAIAGVLGAISDGRRRLADLAARLAELRQQRQRLDQAPPEPPRTPEQEQARLALAGAGIPFLPLYEALEFGEELAPEEAARLEQSLAEMGLLDALVVTAEDRPRAIALLRAQGLSERLLLPEAGGWLAEPPMAEWLRPDSANPLAEVAAHGPIPQRDLARGVAAILPDGTWRHGLLEGVTAPSAAARYIGRSARERFRLAEIARVEREIAAAEAAERQEKAAVAALEGQAAGIQAEWAALEARPAMDSLHSACLELEHRRIQAEEERKALEAAQVRTAAARSAWDREEATLQAEYQRFPAAAGLSREGLQAMVAATRETQGQFEQIYHHARTLQLHREAVDRIAEQLATEADWLEEREAQADDMAVGIRELEGRRRGLERLVQSPDAQALFRRMAEIRRELSTLDGRRLQCYGAEAVATDAVQRLEGELPALRVRAAETSAEAGNARIRLQEAVNAYPSLQAHAASATDDQGARRVAQSLLNRFDSRTSLVDDIRDLEAQDRSALSRVFEQNRQTLRPYYPEHLPAERTARLVQFSTDAVATTPHGLLQHLQSQAEVMRTVLQRHEAELFERHLLQDVGREVRRCMLKARDWVEDINEKLSAHPLRNEERVVLDWEPKRTEHELGGTIARHAGLLWIEEADLTPAQRDTLKGAFQEEIRQIREQARRGEWRSDVFREKLGEVLDYRNWFRFRICVKGGVGGKTEITDTVFNARSGSERALVLLLPLIAGLSVRFDAASPDAPRLVALDEGFAGIDAVNSRQLIRFLTSLRLTWVVSSEKPPALTEDLPGASLYSMLREGTVVATRPFFWDGVRMLDAETDFGEVSAHGE